MLSVLVTGKVVARTRLFTVKLNVSENEQLSPEVLNNRNSATIFAPFLFHSATLNSQTVSHITCVFNIKVNVHYCYQRHHYMRHVYVKMEIFILEVNVAGGSCRSVETGVDAAVRTTRRVATNKRVVWFILWE